MRKNVFYQLMLLAAALCLAACTTTAPEGKPYDELPPLTQEKTWNFFKALPAAALPAKVATLEQREAYMKHYLAMMEETEMEYDFDADYNPDDPTNFSTITWSEAMLGEEEAFEAEHGGESEYVTLLIYPGVDPDKLFGIMQRGSFSGEGSTTLPETYYWYSISKNKVSQVSALPLDKPYSEEDITADPLLTFGSEGLYYAIKQKDYEQIYMPKYMQVYINMIGMTDVVYDWNGVQFVRNASYKSPIIYNYGFGNISLGGKIPWNVNGYSTHYIDSEGGPRYDVIRDGETTPTIAVLANPYDDMKIWAIYVYSDRYTNYHDICPGMEANEVIRILEETDRKWYGGQCPPVVSPEYNDPDGREYAVIMSGFDDNFMYYVDKDKYMGDNKFAPGARVLAIVVINAVG